MAKENQELTEKRGSGRRYSFSVKNLKPEDSLNCPMCDSELVYSGGTNDLGCNDVECIFALSFSISPGRGILWDIRMSGEGVNYDHLILLLKEVERRALNQIPLALNVPNLPIKKEKSKVEKLAFRYNLEAEDLFSIKYSTESIDRLAMFYNLTEKDIRHIKQADVLTD